MKTLKRGREIFKNNPIVFLFPYVAIAIDLAIILGPPLCVVEINHYIEEDDIYSIFHYSSFE